MVNESQSEPEKSPTQTSWAFFMTHGMRTKMNFSLWYSLLGMSEQNKQSMSFTEETKVGGENMEETKTFMKSIIDECFPERTLPSFIMKEEFYTKAQACPLVKD